MLFNEPKLLKFFRRRRDELREVVSVLFNEPKLLKFYVIFWSGTPDNCGFSALQRAEIAEICRHQTERG